MMNHQAVLIKFSFPEEQTGEQVAACKKRTESVSVITLTARRERQNFCTADLSASGLFILISFSFYTSICILFCHVSLFSN